METRPPDKSGESDSVVGNSTESDAPPRPSTDLKACVTARCADRLRAESRFSGYSRRSATSAAPTNPIDPLSVRTFPDGRAARDPAPAADPGALGPPDCESGGGDDAAPAVPGAESSAAATTGQAAIAKPSPSAKAAEPTRTPNATAFMTPPTVANQLRCLEYSPVAVVA